MERNQPYSPPCSQLPTTAQPPAVAGHPTTDTATTPLCQQQKIPRSVKQGIKAGESQRSPKSDKACKGHVIVHISNCASKLSVALGAVLFMVLAIQIFLGVLCQKEVIKLYSMETPQERRLSYLGELLCSKDCVYDLKVNGSTSYIRLLQEKQASRILRDRVRITLRSEKYYMLNLLLMLLWLVTLVGLLLKRLSAGTVAFSLFATLLGVYPVLTGYLNTLSYYFSSL